MRCLHCGKDGIALSTNNCPQCGVYLPSLMQDVLPHSTRVNQNYHIDYALGRGGFGITYRAIHIKTEQQVAIKEYYPREYAVRIGGEQNSLKVLEKNREAFDRGLQRFIKEAKNLAKINHPNIVRLQGFFEENETAYIVMELIRGRTLREELDLQPHKCFAPKKVKKLMNALIAAVSEIHRANIYHLDIKPENILLTPQGRIVLVDFGSSKQGISTESTQAFTIAYAPLEVISGGIVGAYSDIFELGAIAYEMLTGQKPLDALKRLQDRTWQPDVLEQPWQNLIETALNLEFQKRPQNVELWWESNFNVAPVLSSASQLKNSGTLELLTKPKDVDVLPIEPEIIMSRASNSQLEIVKPRYPTVTHGDIFAIDTKVTYLSNGRETKSNNGALFNVSWCIFLSEDPSDLLIQHYRQKFAREKIVYHEVENKWSVNKGLYENREYTITLQILSVKDKGYHNSFSLPTNIKSVITTVLEKKQQDNPSPISSPLKLPNLNLKILQESIAPPIERASIFSLNTEVTYLGNEREFKIIKGAKFKVNWCAYASRDSKDLLIQHYFQKFTHHNIRYQSKQNKWYKKGFNQNKLPYILTLQILSPEDWTKHNSLPLPANTKTVITLALETQEKQELRTKIVSWLNFLF